MKESDGKGRPLLFYVNIAAAAVLCVIVTAILSGGFTLGSGVLRLDVGGLTVPVAALVLLLALRHALLARGEGTPALVARWFGPTGSPQERWRSVELLGILTLLFVLIVSAEISGRYGGLAADGFGLAAAVQALWNTMDGRILAASLGGVSSYLGLHFSPGLAVLAPVVIPWSDPLFLQWLAVAALALGAWPVYLLAFRDSGERRWAVVLAALYLAHPLLRGMSLNGFDPAVFSVTPFLIAFYLLDDRRRPAGYVFLLGALLMSEGAWLAAAFFGLYLAGARRRWREGLFLFIPTFYGYILLLQYAMPAFGSPVLPSIAPWGHLGSGIGEVLKTVVLQPHETWNLLAGSGRGTYLLLLLGPLAFLPFLGPARLAPAIPILLADLLAGDPQYHSALSPHGPMVVPFLFAAASAGAGRLLGILRGNEAVRFVRPALAALLLAAVLLAFGPVPLHGRRSDPAPAYAAEFASAAAAVPADASVAASGILLPYLCRRQVLRQLEAAASVEFVVADLGDVRREGGGETAKLLLDLARTRGLAVVGGGRHVAAIGPPPPGGVEPPRRLSDLLADPPAP
jgi:uncharacterized membrane protein